VKTAYASSFVKDLKQLRGQPMFKRIQTLAFETVALTTDLNTLANLKKLQGHTNAYRIRMGDYRIGLTSDGETVTFKRVLHRKDIYRYFP